MRSFPAVTLLQGTREAHEDEHVYCEQVGQEEISRAGAARQQPGEVQAPPSEPPSARKHAAAHLEGQTARHQLPTIESWHINVTLRGFIYTGRWHEVDEWSTFCVIRGWFGLRLTASHSSSVSISMLKSLWPSLDRLRPNREVIIKRNFYWVQNTFGLKDSEFISDPQIRSERLRDKLMGAADRRRCSAHSDSTLHYRGKMTLITTTQWGKDHTQGRYYTLHIE